MSMILHEMSTNAVKHGGARQVDLAVRQVDGGLELVVANPQDPQASHDFVPQTISERVELLGGTLAITGENGQTTVTIWLPAANDL